MDLLEEVLPQFILEDFLDDFESLDTEGLEMSLESQGLEIQNLESQNPGLETLLMTEIMKDTIIPQSATSKPRFSFPVLEKVHPKPATEGKAKQPVKMEPNQVNPETSAHDPKQVNPESAENDPKQVNPESAETEVKQANPETSDDDPSVDEEIQQDVRERNPRAVKQRKIYATKKKKDPNAPTSHITAYTFFFRETQTKIRAEKPGLKFPAISRTVAGLWQKMSEDEKSVYRQRSDDDRIRYDAEVLAYAEMTNEGDPKPVTVAPSKSKPVAPSKPKPITVATSESKPVTVASSKSKPATPSKLKPITVAPSKTVKAPKPTKSAKLSKAAKLAKAKVNRENIEKIFGTGSETILVFPATDTIETEDQCMREGCLKNCVINQGWDEEYCSNECLLVHSKEIFKDFIRKRNLI